jgi:cellulose synthase/poly-beta-1,6-N-acetylglucosamine synthase-like glycosyltransferase
MQTAALIALVTAGLFFLYSYAGYPLLLWVWSRLRPRPVRRAEQFPRVSILVAVHNEVRAIAQKCENLLALDYPPDRMEIVLVSDGSGDRTVDIALAQRDPRVRVVSYEPRRGKAWALNCGASEARGEILVLTDARQTFPPDALKLLVQNFADVEIGAVSGEMRFGGEATEFGGALSRYWSYEKQLRRMESEIDSTCGVTGCIWALRRELFSPLPEGLILDDVYLPMEVVRRGYRVVFDSRAVAYDQPSPSAEIEYQRKRRTLLGNYQLLAVSPWILTPRNRIWFQFISHKVCRLLIPVALLLTLTATLILRGLVFRGLLAAQLAFYALGLFERFLPQGTLLRKVSALSSFFTLVHIGAVTGFVRWMLGREDVWTRPPGNELEAKRHR